MLQKDVNKSFWTCHEKLMFFLKALPQCEKILKNVSSKPIKIDIKVIKIWKVDV